MKVFDLQCSRGHQFEGWFASHDDYASQQERGLLTCPLCSDVHVNKLPSAPRLNLDAGRQPQLHQVSEPAADVVASLPQQAMVKAWMKMVKQVMDETEDVGRQFSEEARRIHYGEAPERGIRGQSTAEETQELLQEGIAVMPLALPDHLKTKLQ